MERKKTQRSPEHIIKLYDWLWLRAKKDNKHTHLLVLTLNIKTYSLTERCILLLAPQMLRIRRIINTPAFRKAVLEIITSN